MSKIAQVVYTARTECTGGRENGAARSSDGLVDIRLSTPGSARIGTNPEQLLAIAWSASFASAVTLAAGNRKIKLRADVKIHAEVELASDEDGYLLGIRLNVKLPGIEPVVANALLDQACLMCPYSRATRSNVEIKISLI